jgi:hypothetical protein
MSTRGQAQTETAPADELKNLERLSEQIQELKTSDVLFVPFLVAQQKLLYKFEKWDQFFANAIFFRTRFLAKKNPPQESQLLIALEVLALAKHCQWEKAKTITSESVKILKPTALPRDSISEALDIVVLHENFPKQNSPEKFSKAPRNYFTSNPQWKIQKKYFKLLTHPKNLRVHVEHQCRG